MKSTRNQSRRSRVYKMKALFATIFVHALIIGGLMFATGELGTFLNGDNPATEEINPNSLNEAITDATSKK